MNDYLNGLVKHHWRADRLPGKADNTYTHRTRLTSAEVEAARFDDYQQGFAAGTAAGTKGAQLPAAKTRYARQHHGEIVDLAVFELGYMRGITARGI